jgi:phage terminase small subunit
VAGKPQKAASALQNKWGGRLERRGPELRPVTEGSRPIPRCPSGLHPRAQRQWRAFWLTPAGAATDDAAYGPMLEHWITCVSERFHTLEAIAKEPTVKGSMDQDAMNPLLAYLKELERKIEKYEEAFGMHPLAAMRLNIAAVQHASSVYDLTARLERRRAADAAPIEAEVIDIGELG